MSFRERRTSAEGNGIWSSSVSLRSRPPLAENTKKYGLRGALELRPPCPGSEFGSRTCPFERKMAAVRDRLKKVKPTAKNAVEKYREVLDYALKNVRNPKDQEAGLQAFLTAGELKWHYKRVHVHVHA